MVPPKKTDILSAGGEQLQDDHTINETVRLLFFTPPRHECIAC